MVDRPLRVAFLLPSFPELSNTFILTQITGLIDRGHQVDLFARERKPFDGSQPDVARYELVTRMRHVPVPRSRGARLASAVRLLAGPRGWHPAMRDALDRRRHARDAWNLVQLHTAASFLRAPPYDVLHCQFGNLGPAAARLVALGAVGAKLVTSFRGADLTIHVAADPARFRELFDRGALFLPVSRVLRNRLLDLGVPPECVLVHHSGIQLARFPFAVRAPHDGPNRLLFVGRLTEKKGLAYLLEALAMLHDRGPQFELTVVGDGRLAPELREQSARLGLGGRVRFLGSQTQDEVVALMQASDVLAAPSVTAASGDQEGIPNVLKEAMATGLPVVATRHGGIPELVEDGVSGFLAPERDASALAACLERTLRHPECWAEWGRAGREKVERDFDAERLNDLLVARYRAVLDDPPPRPPRPIASGGL